MKDSLKQVAALAAALAATVAVGVLSKLLVRCFLLGWRIIS